MSNFKHTMSSISTSLKDIQNLDSDPEDNDYDNRSVYSNKSMNSNYSIKSNNTVKSNNTLSSINQYKPQLNSIRENNYQNQRNYNNQHHDDLLSDALVPINNNSIKRNIIEEPNSFFYNRKNNNNNFIENEELNQQYDEEVEEDVYREVLDESNPEFIEFKNNVKEWLQLDDDIKTLQKAATERRKRKNDLTPFITGFMGRYEIEDLNTHEGKVQYAKSIVTKPMNKDFIKQRLTEFLKSMDKAEKCTKYLMENRIKEERVRLKRVNPKKK